MIIENKNIVVVGLGSSGTATALFLRKRGALVTATDMADQKDLGPDIQKLRETGVMLELGEHRETTFDKADMIVISPGVPHTITPVNRARERGTIILGEIELASRFIDEPIVAITGTNGKTTTTTLIGEMFTESGFSVFVGGNIGRPLIGYADDMKKSQVVVAEISSFQLDTIDTFRPNVAVLLNIAKDHLDRYPDFTAYAMSKARIFKNQKSGDSAIINGSDPVIPSVIQHINSRTFNFFNTAVNGQTDHPTGTVITKDRIIFQSVGGQEKAANNRFSILDRSDIKLRGNHNMENAAAAGLAVMAGGGHFNSVKTVLKRFTGLPHRLEYTATIKNAAYYNDSKATNVDAVIRAIECFDNPVILILGGRNKESNFKELENTVKEKVKSIIAIGETKEEIKAVLKDTAPVETAATMEDAVFKSNALATPGDVVLLSPACASFDMYNSYAHRGEAFSKAVDKLKKRLLNAG